MKRLSSFQLAITSCSLLVVSGLVAIVLGQRVVARTEAVYAQIPALVSGGVAGMACVLLGCVFAFVQVSRHCAAQERAQEAEVLAEVVALTEVRRRLAATKPLSRKGSSRRARTAS
jgi:hypothetical protein